MHRVRVSLVAGLALLTFGSLSLAAESAPAKPSPKSEFRRGLAGPDRDDQ